MPVKLKITFLFLLINLIILTVICGAIYFFASQNRINSIQLRVLNRAKTTERLLADSENFDQNMVMRIDSLTLLSIVNKSVQCYDSMNNEVYSHNENPGDTLVFKAQLMAEARKAGTVFFSEGIKEGVAYCNLLTKDGLVVVSSGEDLDGRKNLRQLSRILIFSFLAGNLLILLCGYFFSGRLLLPVQKITADVEEISAQNLARRIKTGSSQDEWHQLSLTLNRLLDRLQQSFEWQTRFISNASHELSTPLTSISSQLEVSLQREREGSEYRKVMESIYQDVRQMSKLTQTLLQFAKASGSRAGLDLRPLRIDEILLAIPAEIAKLNSQYHVSLEFGELPEDEHELLVYGNEALLQIAIRNIVLNACKYSEDRKATMKLEIRKNILITIADKGKGIPPEELKAIFQPFYRIEENLSGQGFGLGLSLTDRIIKLHKGSIIVDSEVNIGTSFSITLPPARALR